ARDRDGISGGLHDELDALARTWQSPLRHQPEEHVGVPRHLDGDAHTPLLAALGLRGQLTRRDVTGGNTQERTASRRKSNQLLQLGLRLGLRNESHLRREHLLLVFIRHDFSLFWFWEGSWCNSAPFGTRSAVRALGRDVRVGHHV